MNQSNQEFPDHKTKGLPFDAQVTTGNITANNWNVLRGDLPLPLMLLKESALRHNLDQMAAWCAANNFLLAPHGKTTMCPQLFRRQIEHGAWGITVATISQAMVCHDFDINRIFIANQVTGAANVRSLTAMINSASQPELYCLIDSVEGVRQLAAGLERFGARRPLNVLVEWGRWRTGVRSLEQGIEVFDEALRHPRFLKLCGFEAFEGLASSSEGEDVAARIVDDFLDGLKRLGERLRKPGEQTLLSIGGSAYLDRVQHLAAQAGDEFQVMVRSGCYVTHDHVHYEVKQKAARSRVDDHGGFPDFIPALELWAYVQSRPEPHLALLTFGKRDCPFDLDMPVPLLAVAEARPLGEARKLKASRVTGMNDQHGYLSLADGEDLQVGEMVSFGISHPCTAFDKWRAIPVVNDDYDVIDLYLTYF